MKKNKSLQSELVTKGYLDKSLKKFVTKQYLDKRLDERFDKNTKAILKYIDYKIEPLEEMRKDYYKFKDSVLKSLDWLVGAFKKFDEEHTVLTGSYSDIRQKVDNHEKRLSFVEDKIRS